MSERQQMVFDRLDRLGIKYEVTEHAAVFTIEEMDNLHIDEKGEIAKNLFLRDAKGTRHFLVVLRKEKQADLKALKEKIGSGRLSFASAERLQTYLKLEKGAVTPMGLILDQTHTVEVILDKDLEHEKSIGVHPNENTATIWLSFADLCTFVRKSGNPLKIVKI